jgi:hypothetical protein
MSVTVFFREVIKSMRNGKTLAIVIALGLGLILSAPFAAQAKKGGGGDEKESQKGGLPALEDRVETDEGLITTLQSDVLDLQGQNNFACVASDGTLGNHSSSVTGSTLLATGEFEVDFSKDVSACAPVATIGTNSASSPTPPISAGFISVAGDPSATTDPADGGADSDAIFVQTENTGGTLTSLGFCLYVSCP